MTLHGCHEWAPQFLSAFVPWSFLQAEEAHWTFTHTLSPEVQGSSLCFWEMGVYGKVHSFSSEADSIWFLRRSQAGLKPVAMVVTCLLTHALLSFSPFATTSLLFHGITLQANYSDMDLISASAFGGTQKSTSGKLSTLGCQWRAQSDSTLRRG